MLQYVQIKFVFLGTSMQLDVADNFEKRIKSRFSHRQVLLYKLDVNIFHRVVNNVLSKLAYNAHKMGNQAKKQAMDDLTQLAKSGGVRELLEYYQETGK